MSQAEVLKHARLMLYIHEHELNDAGLTLLHKAIAALVADTTE